MASPHYEIIASMTTDIGAICLSLDAERPGNYYAELELDLSHRQIKGNVLIDLLASNGKSSKRFFLINFDGQNLELHTLREVNESDLSISSRTQCRLFYQLNANRLFQSVLSLEDIQAIARQEDHFLA